MPIDGDQVLALVRQAAKGQVEAFIAIVQEFGPDLRLWLAAHLDRHGALAVVEPLVWSVVRSRLGEFTGEQNCAAWIQQLAREPLTDHLLHADRRAIELQDTLAHEIIRGCQDALVDGRECLVTTVRERLAALPETTRTLLTRRYRDRQRSGEIATSSMISENELAVTMYGARSACDWRDLAKPPAVTDRLLPPLIEDWLNGTIDADSRALLATNLGRDAERAAQFARQVRVHLALHAGLAPFGRDEAVAIVRQTGLGAYDSSRIIMGAGPRPMAATRSPGSDPRRTARTTSNARHTAGGIERQGTSPTPWIVGGGMVAIGAIALLVMSFVGGDQRAGALATSATASLTDATPTTVAPSPTTSLPTTSLPTTTPPPRPPATGGVLRPDQPRPPESVGPPTISLDGAITSGRGYSRQPLELRAALSHTVGITAVEFRNGGERLGVVTSPPYVWTWEQPLIGTASITALALNGEQTVATSTPASVTIAEAFGSGSIRREWWTNVDGWTVADGVLAKGYPDRPDGEANESRFSAPRSWGDLYFQRLRGFITPPFDGDYVFWIACDDDGELWLSQDDQPAGLRRIAVSPRTPNFGIQPEEWEYHASQRSADITLKRGQRYYVEARHKEGTGRDHVAVGWRLPDGTLERPIPGVHLTPATDPVAPLPSPAGAVTPIPPLPLATATWKVVQAINLGGEPLEVDGVRWTGQRQAEADGATPVGSHQPGPWLSDLHWLRATTGVGHVIRDRSMRERPLTMGGKVYAKGLGVHAPSEVVYALDGSHSAFSAVVGIDDEASRGKVIFQVWLDERKVFDSGTMRQGAGKEVMVPLLGGKELRLVVDPDGDIHSDHADWANAQLWFPGGNDGTLQVKHGRRATTIFVPKPAIEGRLRAVFGSALAATKEGLSFRVKVPNGPSRVWLWVGEPGAANSRSFDLVVEGITLPGVGGLPTHGWEKLGPVEVTVTDGLIDVAATPMTGTPQVMGILVEQPSPTP